MNEVTSRVLFCLLAAAAAGCEGETPCGDACAEATCEPGRAGCECLAYGRCAQGNGPGIALACSDGLCRQQGCSEGTADCSCTPAGDCSDGTVCVAGRCVHEPSQVLAPPAEPVCYSPCSQGLRLADGTYLPCLSDGLIEACVGGTTCVEGSCVASGEGPRTCAEDADCSDFQACTLGRCTSNCRLDTDCGAGLACHRMVCRLPCSASGDDCAAGQFCATVDGEHGYCMPLATPDDQPQVDISGGFLVSASRLTFSNIDTTHTVTIINDSPTAQAFVVRKVRHTELTDSGPLDETDDPLFWLELGPEGNAAPVPEYEVTVDADGGTAVVEIAGAANPALPAWDGVIEIANDVLGTRRISLSYVQTAKGRWSGRMYYFTSFGDTGLDAWVAAGRPDTGALSVGNAFIQKWSAFKHGRILTFDEWLAILAATRSESWDWASTRALCTGVDDLGPQGRCFLFDGVTKGWVTYSNNVVSTPIPSGVVDFPFQLHVEPNRSDPTRMLGRIDTAGSLHEPGNAAIALRFAADPADAANCRTAAGNCIIDLVDLQADIRVGGRYLTDAADASCAAAPGFELTRAPWLVDGFVQRTEIDGESGLRYRYECRSPDLPLANPDNDPNIAALNLSMAGSNPVPDAGTRRRRFDLVDGALINNDTLFVIFEETFESFLDDDFSAYGYILLQRSAAELEANDYVGSVADDATPEPPSALGAACSAGTLTAAGLGSSLPSGPLDAVVQTLLDGIDAATTATYLPSGSPPYVHYLCTGVTPGDPTTRGTFDSGPVYLEGGAIACPPGSTVRYFVLDTMDDAAVAHLPCQELGTCHETFATWEQNCEAGSCTDGLRLDPPWRCQDANEVYCDDDRLDLRNGKQFYDEQVMAADVLVPLATEVDNAFRYRTRFRSRSGTGLGFAPDICAVDSDALPYCYDPPAIEMAAGRTDCLTHIFSERFDDLSTPVQQGLLDYLKQSFAWYPITGGMPTHDGFERLYAELLIMLGDDAFTRAFASRFDLAGSAVYGFEGSLFEPGGIDLSGGAGFEMYQLYRAGQYYQQALDRFYSLLPYIWQAANSGDASKSFVTLGTVTAYLDRVIRASTQKSRVASEIAKRYQRFNKPGLARHVVERGYASMYMESVIIAQLMLRMVDAVEPPKRPQVVSQIRFASLGYRSALMHMQGVYDDISDNLTLFGFAPEYVPFPALDTGDTNAFAKLFASARNKAAVATEKERQALDASRTYETDAVSFQNELTRIRNNCEGELARLCGTMAGEDGNIYPAIPKYAHLNELARLMGDPCGYAGNGAIHEAMAEIEITGLDLEIVVQDEENLLDEVDLEVDRVGEQCDAIYHEADFLLEMKNDVHNLEDQIGYVRAGMKAADAALELAKWKAGQEKCLVIAGTASGTDCAGAVAGSALVTAMTIVNRAAKVAGEVAIGVKEDEITQIQDGAAWWETTQACTTAKIDSAYRVKTLLLRLRELDLEAIKAQYRMALAASKVQKLHNEAQRLISEQAETEQQTINLEAARNDPNVRIYKNDSVLTADRTFQAAVREAYKATKVFEYYTSQSYGLLGDLFLVRMVSHGDISLEYYLDNLEAAFVEFEEQFGNPDVRVAILSLRDDVMQIPRIDGENRSISHDERIEMFRVRLRDPRLLDEHGYTTVPFSTSLSTLSPLTRNHKIRTIEAEIVGSDVGDPVARVYLRQAGTGVVRGVDDVANYFSFPERTAVINPFINGARVFPDDVYRSNRLKDRPYVSTRWEVVLNQRDERVNKDVNLGSLSDIRLYVYYTDFTPF
jgi:hypothetical protein